MAGFTGVLTGFLDPNEFLGYKPGYNTTTYDRLVSPPVISPIASLNSNRRGIYDTGFYFSPALSKYNTTYFSNSITLLTGDTVHTNSAGIFGLREFLDIGTLGPKQAQYMDDDSLSTQTVTNHTYLDSFAGATGNQADLYVYRLPGTLPAGATINYVRVFKALHSEEYISSPPDFHPTGKTHVITSFWLGNGTNTGVYTGTHGHFALNRIYDLNLYPFIDLDVVNITQYVERFYTNPKTNLPWTIGEVSVMTGGYTMMKVPGADNEIIGINAFSISVAWTVTGTNYTEVTDAYEYEIGITPDLGWANQLDMFNTYNSLDSTRTNSALILKKMSSAGWQYDPVNRAISMGLSEDEIQKVLSFGYPEYLWAVRSYDKFGNASPWSEVRKFYGVHDRPLTQFDLQTDLDGHNFPVVTLYGKKDPGLKYIEVSDDTGMAYYPNSDSWRCEFVLTGGLNELYIRGIPYNGIPTAYYRTKAYLETGQVYRHSVYNTFDDFGALHGVDRLTSLDESNVNYRERIKDVFIHPANSNLVGLHNSIARNLNLSYDDAAITIVPNTLPYSGKIDRVYPDISMIIDTNYIFFSSLSFVVENEYHKVDPQDLSIDFNQFVNLNEQVKVYCPYGVEVPVQDYIIDRDDVVIRFLKDKYIDKEVYVSYKKLVPVEIGTDQTLSEVVTGINAITYNGYSLFVAELSSNLSGDESSDGLLRGLFNVRSTERYRDADGAIQYGTKLRWTDISIHRLSDKEYQNRFLNSDGTTINSAVEGYIETFKDIVHQTWDRVELDRDVWDPVPEDELSNSLSPTILDSQKGYWVSYRKNGEEQRMFFTEAFNMAFNSEYDRSRMVYKGLKTEDFKSGIGDGDDLKLIIYRDTTEEVLQKPSLYRSTVSWEITGQITDSSYLPNTIYGGILFKP